jgi:NDP-sugar pyrophosphorylase family protein
MTKGLSLLIPAAGKGSRFSEVGIDIPKPLIPIREIPMLVWVIANFPLNESDRVKILCQKSHQIPLHLSPYLSKFEFHIDFLEIDYWTEGPAHSLEILLQGLESDLPVICANSDQYIFGDLVPFFEEVKSGKSSGQILTMNASSSAWSYVGRNESGKINRVVEKEEISNEATVGVYGWRSVATLRSCLAWQREVGMKVNNEFYVAPSYEYLIKDNQEISTFSIGKHEVGVHGLGTPSDLDKFLKHGKLEEVLSKLTLKI